MPVKPTTRPTSGKIDSLQVLRAFASALVMVFHGTIIIRRELGYEFLDNFFCAGFAGVDIFFVISGFVIFYTSSGKSISAWEFFKKRAIRIYPTYWIVTAVLITLYVISPTIENARRGDGETILKSILLWPQQEHVLSIAWTLSYEIIFYLVFASTFFISRRFFFTSFAVWTALIIVLDVSRIRSATYAVEMLVNPIIINFGFGCVIGYLFRKGNVNRYRKLYMLIGAAWFCAAWICFYYFSKGGADTGLFAEPFSRVLLFGVPSALFIHGVIYMHRRIHRLWVHLGNASYALYLIHGTVISVIATVIAKLGLAKYFSNVAGALIIFAATIATASLFYIIIEKPLLRLLSRRFAKPATISMAAVPVLELKNEETSSGNY